jgi:hypothetical protein
MRLLSSLFLLIVMWDGRASAAGVSADGLTEQRVFVCGHSFMIYTAKLLPPMAQAAGLKHITAGQQMIGGSRVIQHWQLPDEQNRAKVALRNGKVDVLTVSPHMQLPDEGVDNFTRLGLEHNPNLRVLVQASWPPRDGDETNSFTNETRNNSTVESLHEMKAKHRSRWILNLEAQVRALNESVGRTAVFILPVSDAVFALREHVVAGKAPGLHRQSDLFRDPLGHPQPALAALVTYCHFAAIYRRSPEGLPIPAEIQGHARAEELNLLLQQLAWDAVTQYPMSGVTAAAKE